MGTGKKGWYYRLSFDKKRGLWGAVFLSPWILGFFIFFVRPLIEVFVYSVHDVRMADEGGLAMTFLGLDNYIQALTVDPEFNQGLLTTIAQSLPSAALIIVFSLLSAVLLNGKFRGRATARVIFFIPIIMAAGLVSVEVGGDMEQMVSAAGEDSLLGANALAGFLVSSGFPINVVEMLSQAVSSIFKVITQSGVQTLIFLAGLQSISPALYEVARIEGATGYETFWKVTIPMVTPMILTCSVYSLAEGFLKSDITDRIYDIAFKESRYGLSASMSCIYLVATLLIILLVNFFISRKVFYYD